MNRAGESDKWTREVRAALSLRIKIKDPLLCSVASPIVRPGVCMGSSCPGTHKLEGAKAPGCWARNLGEFSWAYSVSFGEELGMCGLCTASLQTLASSPALFTS
jgi:hypothetical protein